MMGGPIQCANWTHYLLIDPPRQIAHVRALWVSQGTAKVVKGIVDTGYFSEIDSSNISLSTNNVNDIMRIPHRSERRRVWHRICPSPGNRTVYAEFHQCSIFWDDLSDSIQCDGFCGLIKTKTIASYLCLEILSLLFEGFDLLFKLNWRKLAATTKNK